MDSNNFYAFNPGFDLHCNGPDRPATPIAPPDVPPSPEARQPSCPYNPIPCCPIEEPISRAFEASCPPERAANDCHDMLCGAQPMPIPAHATGGCGRHNKRNKRGNCGCG